MIARAKETIATWKPNGCTGVPDWFRPCCDLHDRRYHEQTMTRALADAEFRRCIQSRSRLGRASPLALWRWLGVRAFGWWPWRKRSKTIHTDMKGLIT